MDEEKRVTVRIPADLHSQVAAQAKADRRSLNSEILYLLEAGLSMADADSDRPA